MRLLSCVLIFYTLMDDCNTQFDFSQFFHQQPPDQANFAYQSFPQRNYYENNQQISPYLMNSYNYQHQCQCSCDKCHMPNPCCTEFCTKCALANNPALYLYPYPYIVVASQPKMHMPPTTVATTTQTTTTEATTTTEVTTRASTTQATTSTTPPEPLPQNPVTARRSGNALSDDILKKLIFDPSETREDKGNIIMTALRRTKPRWMPKYGIVPIPDQIAEKLMLRIRHMKVLHPEVDTIRRIDPI